jgi:hypothetical protein
MKWTKCQRDGLECDLNPARGTCRHLDGHKKIEGVLQAWSGQCFDRIETKEPKPAEQKPQAHRVVGPA